jgi:hypothetical protein
MELLLPSTDDIAKDEQPFVFQLAWAYYLAYTAIINSACILSEYLRAGIEEPKRCLTLRKSRRC